MIIVEGMDNSGKDYLCKSLSKELGLKMEASLGPASRLQALNYIRKTCTLQSIALHNRYFIISESVYGPVLRGKSFFGDAELIAFEILARADPMIVYCRPDDGAIKNWQQRAQMKGVKENAPRLIQRYDYVMDKLVKPVLPSRRFIEYNWRHDHLKIQVLPKLQAYLNERRKKNG